MPKRLAPHMEVRHLGKRSADLALFWRREQGDALALLAGLILSGRPVTVRHIDDAVAILRQHEAEGAHRFANRLLGLTVDRSDQRLPWYIEALPDTVTRRASLRRYRCAYLIEPTTKLHCANAGLYVVPGAKGTFCGLHAYRTVRKVERHHARARGGRSSAET